ncbi:hypothetical protein QJS10_CPA05g01501 [Acorus calamus]|uniref:Mechanosensitive ion channel protein 2/3 C-terminal domain-containing protein n=1 Tax=Acorus calamus TaxID=4465 RepID=A0AAV9EQR3_ACOCL|nr:hypothetical protein QJS10_CPA05g01501 [Acorus calamus]
MIMVSCFVKTSHFEEYLCVKEAILLDLLTVIRHHKARLATPIRTVQKVYSDANLEFTHVNGAARRPLLLIEPPYRINSENKSKSHLTRPAEDLNGKPAVTSDPKTTAPALDGSDSKQQKKQNCGDSPLPISSESNKEPTVVDKGSMKTQHAKNVSEKSPTVPSPPSTATSRSALEDNIVLGVALEGSKRTLPIDEDMASSPALTEYKELASRRNAKSSSTTTTKDFKDGQVPPVTGPMGGDN